MANLSIDAARNCLLAAVTQTLPREQVTLAQALGRRLAVEVRTDGPWPATDRSAMDGFAVAAGADGLRAGTRLPVAGESLAGHPFRGTARGGTAIRIMTGAVVPAGFDAVVPVEQTSGYEGTEVELRTAVERGSNIRPRGSEARAGDVVLRPGALLRAAEIGVLAVLGIEPVTVHQRPRVAILATGDEVVPITSAAAEHQVRDSNSHALAAQVLECGGEPLRLGIAPDDAAELTARIARGLAEADLLLTIGGVSKGTHDLVGAALAQQGVQSLFHGIDLKPGKPTFAGTRRTNQRTVFVLGLPGNPASCFTVFDLLAAPLLARLGGACEVPFGATAQLGGVAYRRNARLQAIPARASSDADGHLLAELQEARPSGDPFGLTAADGYVLIPGETPPGALRTAPFVPYAAGLRR